MEEPKSCEANWQKECVQACSIFPYANVLLCFVKSWGHFFFSGDGRAPQRGAGVEPAVAAAELRLSPDPNGLHSRLSLVTVGLHSNTPVLQRRQQEQHCGTALVDPALSQIASLSCRLLT